MGSIPPELDFCLGSNPIESSIFWAHTDRSGFCVRGGVGLQGEDPGFVWGHIYAIAILKYIILKKTCFEKSSGQRECNESSFDTNSVRNGVTRQMTLNEESVNEYIANHTDSFRDGFTAA